MNKTFIIILLSVFIFIFLNSFFYIQIFHQQRDFQTELLNQQIRICGSTIEQNGMDFESEVNFILYSESIHMLFSDPGVMERCSRNLQLFYTKYENLINYINILDNRNNVYRLLKDRVNNYVSDYYVSQKQATLEKRDLLKEEDGSYYFTVPVFINNELISNIVININFEKYINTVFNQYSIENTLWQWFITEEGRLASSRVRTLEIPENDVKQITNDILEGNEGKLTHTIEIDGAPVKVISVYLPVTLVRKDFGIVFSMKSDLFLRSILSKTFIITIASLFLLILILYLFFRVIKVKTRDAIRHKMSEATLRESIDKIPLGIIIIQKDKKIRSCNQTALEILNVKSDEQDRLMDAVEKVMESEGTDQSVYRRVFGTGSVISYAYNDHVRFFFRKILETKIRGQEFLLISLIDITTFERNRKQTRAGQLLKNSMLENMKDEISVPLKQIITRLSSMDKVQAVDTLRDDLQGLTRSADLLSNLIDATFDFCLGTANGDIPEEIPFSLRDEINLCIDGPRADACKNNTSIITKIRNDVPDRVIGDPFKLRQIIKDLLHNSVESTRDGRILIGAETIIHQADQLKVRFQIEDTGKGLPGELIRDLNSLYDSPEDRLTDVNLDESGLKIIMARRQAALMKGDLFFESPSTISADPRYPGTRYTFTVELIPDESCKTDLDYSAVTEINNIHCLMITHDKDLAGEYLHPLKEAGLTIRQRLYPEDDPADIASYLADRIHEYHLILIPEQDVTHEMELLTTLRDRDLIKRFLILLLTISEQYHNLRNLKDTGVDYYLRLPHDQYRIPEIIMHHFPGIPDGSYQRNHGKRPGKNLRILLADDHIFSRRIAQSMFKSLGYEIDLAVNGRKALEKIQGSSYDIVFLDLLMPEKNGTETATEIRQLGYELPVIALTAMEPDRIAEPSVKAVFNDVIMKPLTIDNIRQAIIKFCSP